MKRTNTKLVKLPYLVEDRESNVGSYDYSKRTAIPTLNEYIIRPFYQTLKEKVFVKAKECIGVDEEGILKGGYWESENIADKQFIINVYASSNISYDDVLFRTKGFLHNAVNENRAGRVKEGVRKVYGDVYVDAEMLMEFMTKSKENECTTTTNKRDVTPINTKTGKRLPYLATKEVLVYLDFKRFAFLNSENADNFHNAWSLKHNIGEFIEKYTKKVMSEHGIPEKGLENPQPFDYELSDTSSVRYLFYPKFSVKHGNVYSQLIGKETKNITKTTGDLDIIKELGFKEPEYEFMKKEAGIKVTQGDGSRKRGIININRFDKDGSTTETIYSMLNTSKGVYVKVDDILNNMDKFQHINTTDRTQLKINVFAPIPEYLK